MTMWKRFNFEGGTADPLIISWPNGIKARGELRSQYCHATDIVPTVFDCLGVELPETVKGYPQVPLEGVGLRSTFEDAEAPTPEDTAFYSMLGSRAGQGLEGDGCSPRGTFGVEPLRRGSMGAVQHRNRPHRDA
jgi:arylsulfatase A-like enzyme